MERFRAAPVLRQPCLPTCAVPRLQPVFASGRLIVLPSAVARSRFVIQVVCESLILVLLPASRTIHNRSIGVAAP